MQILDNEQVCYCNVISQKDNQVIHLPGVFYKNKLFCKDNFFLKEQKREALEYGKQKFLNGKGKIMYLLLEDTTGLTVWIEDPNLKLSKQQAFLDIVNILNIKQVTAQMRSEKGITIKDRRYRLISYPNCFIGSEAVDWMRKNLNLSGEQAVRLGQRLIDEKFIHHVTDEHPFINDFFFYRFYWDEM